VGRCGWVCVSKDGHGSAWVAVGGCGWLRVGVCGCECGKGWVGMHGHGMGGRDWAWVGMDGHGWK
jgi:hypothetical protein